MKKSTICILILLILIGIFLRFYMLNSQVLIDDEHYIIIGSMKFTHSSFEDAFSYASDNPPFGRMFLSIPSIFIQADYENIWLITPLNYILSYISYDAISKNYLFMRAILVFFGILSILFIYLISKELFGSKAAIWSAVLSALSFDLIIYSRIIYMPIFIMFFSLGTILFFMKYVKSKLKIRWFYLGLCYLFLFFAVGSHHVQPWFLIPVLIASQFLFNKKLREDILVSVGYLASFGLMWLIYSINSYYSVMDIIGTTYSGSSNSFFGTTFSFISFTFHDIIIGFLLRNNYVLGLISLICAFVFFKLLFRKKLFGKIKKMVVSRDLKLIILMLFVVSFVGLGFTSLGDEMRHLIFLFIPLYIFSGFVINKLVRKKNILYLVVLLLLISVVQGVYNSPASIINYSNFGVSSYQSETYDGGVHKEVLDYLEGLGNPIVISNDINFLIFYEGEKGPLTMPFSYCVPELFKEMKRFGAVILFKGSVDENDNIVVPRGADEQPYFCLLLEQIELEKIHKFDDDLVLYRLG